MSVSEIKIFLNIYDLHESTAVLSSMGAGVYHTGVEIERYEYSFSPSGVNRTSPRLPGFGQLKEHMLVGIYVGKIFDIRQTIQRLGETYFKPGMYNMTTLNCNHFSDALIFALLDQHIPLWINRMATLGSYVLPASLTASNQAPKEEAFAAPGKPSKPHVSSVLVESKPSNQETVPAEGGFFSSIFSFFAASSTQTTENSITCTKLPATAASSRKYSNPPPAQKKELTVKQKEMLAKIKHNSS